MQDEAQRLARTHEAARRARLVAQAEQAAAQQAATGLMLASEIEAQEKLAKVGRVHIQKLCTSRSCVGVKH